MFYSILTIYARRSECGSLFSQHPEFEKIEILQMKRPSIVKDKMFCIPIKMTMASLFAVAKLVQIVKII